MPTSGDAPDLLVDTSVAVALSVADHGQHEAVFAALKGRQLGLAGHAAFETFSVLTRLPPPQRLTAAAALRLLRTNFPHTRFLDPQRAAELLTALPAHGIAGGSVYDALVGAAAKEHGAVLATCDRRAVSTYRALEVDHQLVGEPGPTDL
jgi:predicted nucleic acid-binding protein